MKDTHQERQIESGNTILYKCRKKSVATKKNKVEAFNKNYNESLKNPEA